ncbi:hypothetical protein AUJ26_01700 [Candidatus Falkowbacteria bacterium CG1_02_37_21]|nr:MAG: hypothetical protein AUJ26_01700 [Candidatus Falkowbacteria bacterium CG1_02_37_21]
MTSDLNNSDQSKEIADLIIEQAYLSNLPEADKNYVRENLALQITRRLGLIIMENLNEEGRLEYSQLLENSLIPDQEKLQELLDKYIPDYAEKVKVGLDEFIKEAVASLTK